MKKFTKILAVLAVLCLLVGAVVLAVSASSEPSGDLLFVVKGTTGEDGKGGYSTFGAAAAAAGSTKTIVLNKDWTVEAGSAKVELSQNTTVEGQSNNGIAFSTKKTADMPVGFYLDSGDYTLDLNGKTVTQNFEGALFGLNGASLRLIGGGTFDNVNTFASLAAGAALRIDTVDDIQINTATGRYAVFAVQNGAANTLEFSGAVNIKPAEEATTVINVGTASVQGTAHSIVLDTAKIFLDFPVLDASSASYCTSLFLSASTGVNVEIKNRSTVEMSYARIFSFSGAMNGVSGLLSLGDYLGYDMKPKDGATAPTYGYAAADASQKAIVSVKDSSVVIVDEVYKADIGQFMHGNIVAANATAPAIVNFDNSYIQFGGSLVYGPYGARADAPTGSAYGIFYAAYHQVSFNNCEIKHNENATYGSATLGQFGANARFKDCYINFGKNGNPTSRSLPYNDLADGEFVGVLFENTSINSTANITASKTETAGFYAPDMTPVAATYNQTLYSFRGTKYTNTSIVRNGELVSCKVIFSNTKLAVPTLHRTYGGDGSSDFASYGNGTNNGGAWNWNMVVWGTPNHTTGLATSEVVDSYGNDCVKLEYTESYTGSPRIDPNAGSSGNYNFGNSKYIISGFDIASGSVDSWLKGASVSMPTMVRFYRPQTIDSEGNYKYYPSGWGTYTALNCATIAIDTDGNLTFKVGATGSVVKTGKTLPADGKWSRFTFVYEIILGDTKTITLPKYTASTSGGTQDGTVDVECVDVSCFVYGYLNGELIGVSDDIIESGKPGYSEEGAAGSGTYFPPKQLAVCFVDHYTLQPSAAARGSIMFDNWTYAAYKTTNGADFEIGLCDESGTPIEDATSNGYLNFMPYNKNSVLEDKAKNVVGTVDGTKYNDEAELIAAIQNGSYVELNRDIGTVLNPEKSFLLNLNGNKYNGFVSETYFGKNYAGMDMVKFAPAAADEIFEVVFKNEQFGIDETLSLALGSSLPELPALESSDIIPWDGELHELVGWETSSGNAFVARLDVGNDGKITMVPVFDATPYFYSTQAEGGALVAYAEESDKASFAANVTEALLANPDKRVIVVLWCDMAVDDAAIALNAASKLLLDLNGNNILIGENASLIDAVSGSEIYIYSADTEAYIYGESGTVLVKALYESATDKGFKLTVGGFSDTALEIEADGGNFAASVTALVEYSSETADPAENSASITLNGGSYSNNGVADAYISVGMDASLDIDGILYAGEAPLVSNENGTLTATVDSSFVAAMLDGSLSFEGSMVGKLSDASVITITGTDIAATVEPEGGSVVIGADCALSYLDGVKGSEGVSAAEGCAFAYGDYIIEVAGEKFPVSGYVDKKEELALVTWYDADNTTPIGTSYNALTGPIVDGENYAAEVKLAVSNEWSESLFTEWALPEVFGAGAVSAYPICDEVVANVKCLKANLTAYTYFRLNYYLPATADEIEGFRLLGIFENEDGSNPLPAETILHGGKEYLMYNEWPGAADVSVNTRYIIFYIGETRYVDSFEFGVPSYVEAVLEDADSSDAEKKLIVNTARYSNESYKLSNGGVGLPAYEEILTTYSDLLVDYDAVKLSEAFINASVSDTTALARNLEGASFIFGSAQPRFVFLYNDIAGVKPPVESNGNIGKWPSRNEGVFTQFYWETYNGGSGEHLAYHIGFNGDANATDAALENGAWSEGDKVYAMTNDLYVCDVTAVINIAVYAEDGTVVRGTYSLATYITRLEATGNNEFYNAAMSLYALSVAAQEYGSSTYLG